MSEFQESSVKPEKCENLENGNKARMIIFDLRKPSNEISPDLEMKVIKNCSDEEYKLDNEAYNSMWLDSQQVGYDQVRDGDYVTVALDRSFKLNNCDHNDHSVDQHNLNHIPKTWPMRQAAKSAEPIYDNIPFETNLHRFKPPSSSSEASNSFRSLNTNRNTKKFPNCDKARNQTNRSADLLAEFPDQNSLKGQNLRARQVKEGPPNHKIPSVTKSPNQPIRTKCCECDPNHEPVLCNLPKVPCCLAYMVNSEYPSSQVRERQKKLRRDAREIKRLIKSYMKRFRTRDKTSKEQREWRIVARVMDRLFFLTYIVIITTSLFGLLPKPEEFRF